MKRIVMAVKDNAIQAFGQPFFVPHVGAATRAFVDDATGDSPVAKHPADYDLYEIGTFDEETGAFAQSEPRVNMIMRGTTAKEMANGNQN